MVQPMPMETNKDWGFRAILTNAVFSEQETHKAENDGLFARMKL
jgi:hypothetical protein